MSIQWAKAVKRTAAVAAAAATLAGVAAGTTVLNNRANVSDRGQVNQAPGNQNGSGQQSTGRDGTQGTGRDGAQVTGRDGTAVTGTDNDASKKQQTIGPGGQGDRPATGNSAPVNAGDGTQRNGDLSQGPRNDGHGQYNGAGAGSTSDTRRSSSQTAQTGGRVNTGPGSQNDSTVTNNYPADAPNAGEATLDSAKPADGGATMGTEAIFSITVKKVPTNGNTLFLICVVKPDNPSAPALYFGRAELTQPGPQKLTIAFGGKWPDDPTLVGSTRTCAIWTATPAATTTLARLMYLDNKQIYADQNGQPYDAERTSLPPDTVQITTGLPIKIQRVGPPPASG
jgi:hypothetical protein